jgi:hypothetical protein
LDSQRLPRSDAIWVIILPTSDDKAGVQFFDRPGGGKRRAALILTQIKVRTSRDFLLLNLSAALKCEATDEICPACAQRYRRNSLVQHTGQSSKLSVVRGVRRDSQWSDELRLCNLSAVSGHYQWNWRVLRPK